MKTKDKPIKNRIIRLAALLSAAIMLVSVLAGCSVGTPSSPTPEKSETVNSTLTPIPTANSSSPSPMPDYSSLPESMLPTLTDIPITPDISIDPMETEYPEGYDKKLLHGPYVYGEEQFYIFLGEKNEKNIAALANSKKAYEFVLPEELSLDSINTETAILSSSIVDLNFDGMFDFSFEADTSGKKHCWLSCRDENGDVTFEYSKELSEMTWISRCFETKTIYSVTEKDGVRTYFGFNYDENGRLKVVSGEEQPAFLWDISTISRALTGSENMLIPGEKVTIRGIECETYGIPGMLTVARDSYGRYYINDFPNIGFSRLNLNPDGKWSKSEKVTLT